MCRSEKHQTAKVNCHKATTVPEMDNQWDTSGEKSEEKEWVEECQFLIYLVIVQKGLVEVFLFCIQTPAR